MDPLTPGSKLGPYEIVAAIGAGGMGEVYRARDPRMGRDVAIKVSAEQFTERFDREVRAVAALNHPNICHLYDVGPNYLVMELVEGEAPRGPLPLEETLRIGRQIAAALEEAHAKGIVHRDLKPANIRIKSDGTVKVLDFGLAKLGTSESASVENSPTLSLATQAGVILGTAAYMSPEQARGKPVDKRADIWAFGVVLYELVTGDRLFTGDTAVDTLIEVATKQPDWARVPAPLTPLLRKCLERDSARRLRDLGDIDLLLSPAVVQQPSHTAARRSTPMLAWGVAGLALLAAGVLAFVHWREVVPEPPALSRFQIPAPPKTVFDNALLLSPDGRTLAFATTGEGGNMIWVRSLDTLQSRAVASWTQNPVPFWSPDSRFIAFQQDGKLKKVDVSGGPAATVCDAPVDFGGGAWSRDNVIVFGSRAGGLMRVAAGGGVPVPLTTFDAKADVAHSLPVFLPDGRHFLYWRRMSNAEKTGMYVGSVDVAPEQQELRLVIATSFGAVYASGYLLFLRDTTLMAQPFDPVSRTLTGDPVPIAEDIGATSYGFGHFSASSAGPLAYRAGGGVSRAQLTWFDRQGVMSGTLGPPGTYNGIALSPDGKVAAVERTDATAPNSGSDLFFVETSNGRSYRFTLQPGSEGSPVWSPDGSRVLYSASREGMVDLYEKASSGAGDESLLFKSQDLKYPTDWSPDGRMVVYTTRSETAPWTIMLLPFQGERTPVHFLKSTFSMVRGKLSPDGRWMAYESNESGRYEIYVQPFPPDSERAGKHPISSGGGSQPRWRADGRELLFLQTGNLMAAEVSTSGGFKAGEPKRLFGASYGGVGGVGYVWDMTADGKRFLVKVVGGGNVEDVTLVLNWTAGLKK
jgi:eukaryotic-like serine/threonine-protein kinase